MGICSGISTEWLFIHCFQIELEFGVLVFVEGGKPENPEKNPRSRDENQQQTQSTCDAGFGNRTRVTAVGGECSHHCAIPAPHLIRVHSLEIKELISIIFPKENNFTSFVLSPFLLNLSQVLSSDFWVFGFIFRGKSDL